MADPTSCGFGDGGLPGDGGFIPGGSGGGLGTGGSGAAGSGGTGLGHAVLGCRALGERTETSTRDGAAINGAEIAIVAWGIGGVVLLLLQAIWRLTPLALEPIVTRSLGTEQACLYVAWVIFSIYAEGYRGFQKRFSPRVVARAFHLARNPRPLHVVLAPAFCMSFFHATRRGRMVAWGITLMVVCFVLTVRYLPQPWRGIIDGGVVIGLGWGTAAILYFFARHLKNGRPDVDPDLPEHRSS